MQLLLTWKLNYGNKICLTGPMQWNITESSMASIKYFCSIWSALYISHMYIVWREIYISYFQSQQASLWRGVCTAATEAKSSCPPSPISPLTQNFQIEQAQTTESAGIFYGACWGWYWSGDRTINDCMKKNRYSFTLPVKSQRPHQSSVLTRYQDLQVMIRKMQ